MLLLLYYQIFQIIELSIVYYCILECFYMTNSVTHKYLMKAQKKLSYNQSHQLGIKSNGKTFN